MASSQMTLLRMYLHLQPVQLYGCIFSAHSLAIGYRPCHRHIVTPLMQIDLQGALPAQHSSGPAPKPTELATPKSLARAAISGQLQARGMSLMRNSKLEPEKCTSGGTCTKASHVVPCPSIGCACQHLPAPPRLEGVIGDGALQNQAACARTPKFTVGPQAAKRNQVRRSSI